MATIEPPFKFLVQNRQNVGMNRWLTLFPIFLLAVLASIGLYLYSTQASIDGSGKLAARLDSFTPGMTEAEVLSAVQSPVLTCVDRPGFFMGSRVCQARVSSYLTVPALFVAFFFKDGGLSGVKVDVPNAEHRAVGTMLQSQYGAPTIDNKGSAGNPGVVGWKLPKGRVVYNREREADPKVHNTILWVSEPQAATMGGL